MTPEETIADLERKLAVYEAGYRQHLAIIADLLRILGTNGLTDEAQAAIANRKPEENPSEH